MAKKITKKNHTNGKNYMLMEKIQKGINELSDLAGKLKTKYDQTDEKTKKKILAGIVGSAALIAGIVGARKLRKK